MEGLILLGYTCEPNVNGMAPVPRYISATPVGRPGIETLDGWNAAADHQNRRSFKAAKGRYPNSRAELDLWMQSFL